MSVYQFVEVIAVIGFLFVAARKNRKNNRKWYDYKYQILLFLLGYSLILLRRYVWS